jgi:hypothetical protein
MAPRGYVDEDEVIELFRKVASGELERDEAVAELERIAAQLS